MSPLTAVDALYAMPFPTYDELSELILNLPQQRAYQWVGELGPNNHLLLKRIFDSKLDKNVVREVGGKINERGGMAAMSANFYMYCHFVGARLKGMGVTEEQWHELHYAHARHIEALWDGVGQWCM